MIYCLPPPPQVKTQRGEDSIEAWGISTISLIIQSSLHHSTVAMLPSLLLTDVDRPQTLAGGGLGQGIHSIMKLLILVSSTAVSKPVISLFLAHLPRRRNSHKISRVETQSVRSHIIR